jgi:hypothetical protein
MDVVNVVAHLNNNRFTFNAKVKTENLDDSLERLANEMLYEFNSFGQWRNVVAETKVVVLVASQDGYFVGRGVSR